MSESERFSLKDQLFNPDKVKALACRISKVYLEFDESSFVSKVTFRFPELELMERVYWVRDCLQEFLPDDYRVAVKILFESLPPPCDPSLSDDDFGDFIYLPYSCFVSEYGCSKLYLTFSLKALKAMTTRFSVEGTIRDFINKFPKETMIELNKWTVDKHYHVRRLASEGTRPKLPWAKKIGISYKEPMKILDVLYSDKTRFVTRSVANHLNDISKIDADLVIKTLKHWQQEGRQKPAELDFITRHSLRTLIKAGNEEALLLLGYSGKEVTVSGFKIETEVVKIGSTLEFSFSVTSAARDVQKLMIDYLLYFQKANGELAGKSHKLAKKSLKAGETVVVSKKHPLRIMTTRKLYPGEHKIELQINGVKFGAESFLLV